MFGVQNHRPPELSLNQNRSSRYDYPYSRVKNITSCCKQPTMAKNIFRFYLFGCFSFIYVSYNCISPFFLIIRVHAVIFYWLGNRLGTYFTCFDKMKVNHEIHEKGDKTTSTLGRHFGIRLCSRRRASGILCRRRHHMKRSMNAHQKDFQNIITWKTNWSEIWLWIFSRNHPKLGPASARAGRRALGRGRIGPVGDIPAGEIENQR